MLRVLTLSTLFPDSARPTFGVFVEQQTLGLAARGDVDLEIVAPIGISPWPLSLHPHYRRFAALPEQEFWKGVIVHRPRFPILPGIGGRWMPGAMARALLPLLASIRERFAFDVIDAEFFYPDGPAAMRLAKAFDVPFSVKARGADIHHWGTRRGCAGQIRKAGEGAAGLLAVSEAIKQDMVGLGIPGGRILVHYTGIDRTRFKPVDRAETKAGLGVAGPLLVTVGALIPRKAQNLVIDALVSVPEATLILVGDGPLRDALETQIVRRTLGDRVRLAGNLPHDEVARMIAAADVMVLPSSSEGLANAWVEALACGTPIVIADVGGAREVVDRPEAGALAARDPSAIATAINAMLADPPDPQAVMKSVERFSWERNSETLFAHLSGLVEGQ